MTVDTNAGSLLVENGVIASADDSSQRAFAGALLEQPFEQVLVQSYPERASVIGRVLHNHRMHRKATKLVLWSRPLAQIRLFELGAPVPALDRFEVHWHDHDEDVRRDLLLSLADWVTACYADSLGLRFWESDRHHRFTLVTDSVSTRGAYPTPRHMTGRTRWELAGVNDPDSDPLWAAHRRDLDAHRPFTQFEYDARAADGSRTRWSVSGRPRFTADGVFVGYTGVVHEASCSAPTDTQAAVPEAVAARDTAPTMLVVDDQRAVRRSIRRMFDRLGWKVAEADCAHAALSLLAGQCRDAELVVADVVMPGGMDGIALAERIRTQYPGIAVVLVSGHRPQGWKASTEILEKPFSEAALLDAARRSGLRAELCARITT